MNILSIKLIERVSDSHVRYKTWQKKHAVCILFSKVLIETDEKQIHTLYGLHDKCSLQPFLIILIQTLHAVFPHRLQAM